MMSWRLKSVAWQLSWTSGIGGGSVKRDILTPPAGKSWREHPGLLDDSVNLEGYLDVHLLSLTQVIIKCIAHTTKPRFL